MEEQKTTEQLEASLEIYKKSYTEKAFYEKLLQYAKVAGVSCVRLALQLWHALQRDDIPAKTKAIIYGALGYFVLPLDLVPDGIPAVGYTDDIGVLMAAVAVVAVHIDNKVKEAAESDLKKWLGDDIEE